MEDEIKAFSFQCLRTLSALYSEKEIDANEQLRKSILIKVRNSTYEKFKNIDNAIIDKAMNEMARHILN